MVSSFREDDENSWILNYKNMDEMNLYITAIYFVVTTIATVGYGDISGNSNKIERLFCIFIMITGVIAFSFASGSLASIL
jgi:hypothetical protein